MSYIKHEDTLHYVFLQHVYTVQPLVKARDWLIWSIPTFCVSTALFRLAKASVWPIVPRNIGLNWFMPALVNSKVGSLWGTTEEEGTANSWVSEILMHLSQNRVWSSLNQKSSAYVDLLEKL